MATTQTERTGTISRAGGAAPVAIVTALVGAAGVLLPSAGFSAADDLPIEAMVAKLDAAGSALMLGGGLQGIAAMALVVYGAFMRRALDRREEPGALTPTIAWGGALLTAAMAAIASAHTQLSGAMEKTVDPTIRVALHTLEENLFAGAWCAVALVSGAVAVAGLRRGAVPRWLGGISAFVTVLLLLAQLVVPWAAWFPAVVWIAVSAVALRGSNN